MEINVAERIRLFRVRTGLSQKEFAEKVGLAPAAMNRLEKGNRQPDVEFLVAVRQLFGADLNELIAGEPDGPTKHALPLLGDDQLQEPGGDVAARGWVGFPEVEGMSFAYRMRDESMFPVIRPGDVLLVRDEPARLGDRLLCRDETGRIRVRQLARRTATGDALLAENPAYPETPLTGEIRVLGKVEAVLRKLPV